MAPIYFGETPVSGVFVTGSESNPTPTEITATFMSETEVVIGSSGVLPSSMNLRLE